MNLNNLNLFPLHNLERFIKRLWRYDIRQVVLTGTNTDPLMYGHLSRLMGCLRQNLHPETQFSLHTNGRLALDRLAFINQFERISLSFPSFDPQNYYRMMGVRSPPDLAQIVRQAQPPIKVSCIVNKDNRSEIGEFLQRCGETGVRRVVLRKLYNERRSWDILLDLTGVGLIWRGDYRRNPVYDYQGLEVTLWDFERSSSTSLNLFSSGLISEQYLLAEAVSTNND